MASLEGLTERVDLYRLDASHDLDTVRHHAEEVIWLHEGRVLQGPVSELLTREKIEEVLNLEFC